MASSKKKITQDELRRLMNEQKKKFLNNVKKIESPLARYDKDGTLHCVICETVVRSDAVWSIHLNSKSHKQNILNKVKKKEECTKSVESLNRSQLKRFTSEEKPVSTKKIKGILKRSTEFSKGNLKLVETFEVDQTKCIANNSNNKDVNAHLDTREECKANNEVANQDVLPEGFFDDPKLDAKVRNVEYKDPIEEEWELFQKEIKEETCKAQQIIAEDQEEATTERQIDEIDEQIRNWSRVVSLEKRKEKVGSSVSGQKVGKNQDDYSGEEEDFEEFLDWRSKKSFDYKT